MNMKVKSWKLLKEKNLNVFFQYLFMLEVSDDEEDEENDESESDDKDDGADEEHEIMEKDDKKFHLGELKHS